MLKFLSPSLLSFKTNLMYVTKMLSDTRSDKIRYKTGKNRQNHKLQSEEEEKGQRNVGTRTNYRAARE